MVLVRERVDDRNGGCGCEFFERGVRRHAGDDDRCVRGQAPGRVRKLLAAGQLQLGPAEDDREQPEAVSGRGEGDSGPRRGCLEDPDHRAVAKPVVPGCRLGFYQRGEIEDRVEAAAVEVEDTEQVHRTGDPWGVLDDRKGECRDARGLWSGFAQK
jgi:hypothetical protein